VIPINSAAWRGALHGTAPSNIEELFTVLDRINVNVTDRVTALVRQLLAKRSIDRPVGPDETLSECGLTSLDTVNLMLAVEAEFDVKIPDRDMTPSNFRSIARIGELIEALLQA
jgi:acyl carrier protein